MAGVLRRLPPGDGSVRRQHQPPPHAAPGPDGSTRSCRVADHRGTRRRPPPSTGPRRCGAPRPASSPTWRRPSAYPPPPASGSCRPSSSRSTAPSSTTSCSRTTGGKVSFTHLIGYAVVKALVAVPAMNAAFVADADGKGTPGVLRPPATSGSAWRWTSRRGAAGPCWCRASPMPTRRDFQGFVGRLRGPDPQDPHQQDRPRRLRRHHRDPHQPGHPRDGAVGAPADARPGRHRRASAPSACRRASRPPIPRMLAELGVGKTVTVTSTYDHRIIQGAESGLFLAHVSECLMGGHGFYEEVFESLGDPLRAGHLAAGRQLRRRRRRRRPRAPRQAEPRADPGQHVPGPRPPHRPPRPARRRAGRPAPRARPAPLRPHHLGPAPAVRGRRPGRQAAGHPRRDPLGAARRLLPDARRRVHAHPGPRAEALDPAARRGRVRPPPTPTSSATSSTGSTPPRSSSASCTPGTWARSASASRAPSRPS